MKTPIRITLCSFCTKAIYLSFRTFDLTAPSQWALRLPWCLDPTDLPVPPCR